jgi:hypothetical protein
MQINRQSYKNRLPSGITIENAKFRMLDVWLWSNIQNLNSVIPLNERSNYILITWNHITQNESFNSATKSDYYGNEDFCYKKRKQTIQNGRNFWNEWYNTNSK